MFSVYLGYFDLGGANRERIQWFEIGKLWWGKVLNWWGSMTQERFACQNTITAGQYPPKPPQSLI